MGSLPESQAELNTPVATATRGDIEDNILRFRFFFVGTLDDPELGL